MVPSYVQSDNMDDEDQEKTTYHEAGHCVMAVQCGARVERATIAPEEDGFHGLVEIHWPEPYGRLRSGLSGDRALDQIYVALAGPVAEMICSGEPYHPGLVPEWAHDWKQAWQLCRPKVRNDKGCLRRLEQSIVKLHGVFSSDEWWAAIAAVSDLLAAHDEIEHDDIAYEVRSWIVS